VWCGGALHGHKMTPDQRMMNTIVHVAETKEQAEAEAIPHIRRFFEVHLRTTPRYLNPPGYVSLDEFKIRAAAANQQHGGFDWDALSQFWRVAVGTPEMVAEKIYKWCEDANSNRIIMWAHLAGMPHWMVAKHLNMFAEGVMPLLTPAKLAEKRKAQTALKAKRKAAKQRAA
jgi:alkanesulfonate monooxygenase SsuD/methylene tetrahydromethanopterin reductase-like flavin-dependent oxidoreductase (luciferase family)